LDITACCGPILAGEAVAATAEALMRSRYTAYTRSDVDYLRESLHPEHRFDFDENATRKWAQKAQWLGLEVVSREGGGEQDDSGRVEFVARYKENGVVRTHREMAEFSRVDGAWYFVEGKLVAGETRVNASPKVGRNDPCPCGSGKKFKKCCGA